MRDLGLPVPTIGGKLLRPVAGFAMTPESGPDLDEPLWMGLLAVQMIHEASLLHDDILDGSSVRRGQPTVAGEEGISAALVKGDHLLTAAYRAAASTESGDFLRCFIRAVERTVHGELHQGRLAGEWLDDDRYLDVVEAKSGELFGCALSLAPSLYGGVEPQRAHELGRRLGSFYQMLDDFVDYCPNAASGKPPLQDYRQRKWTWPLGIAGLTDFPSDADTLLDRLFTPEPGSHSSPMQQAFRRLREEERELASECREIAPRSQILIAILDSWLEVARSALAQEDNRRRAGEPAGGPRKVRSAAPAPAPSDALPLETTASLRVEMATVEMATPVPPTDAADEARGSVVAQAASLGGSEGWMEYFGRNSRSFRFAARLFPPGPRRQVAGVYAFCRFTDDLVDAHPELTVTEREARLDAWADLARAAYERAPTGIPLLDEVMGSSARAEVPFRYAEQLIEGVRMDLRPLEYATLTDLYRYTYSVASVVGCWLTELFGVRSGWVLGRAAALGHAMQITNILRDVGEDARSGRLYLPLDLLSEHGLDRDAIGDMATKGGPIPRPYKEVIERLMRVAEAHYDEAFEAIPELPGFFQRPVAVAAHVYRGIHREIRANGYDNLSRRAYTSLPAKVRLGSGALLALRRLRGRPSADVPLAPPVVSAPGERSRA
jgi:phytoene synthase